MKEQASKERYEKILSAIYNLSEVEAELRYSISPRIVLETAIIKTLSGQSINDRVTKLEKNAQNVIKPTQQVTESAQKPQNEAKEAVKPVEKVAEIDGEIEDLHSINNTLFRELFDLLSEKGAISLKMALNEYKRIDFDRTIVNIDFDDTYELDAVKNNKNRMLMDEFFKSKGLSYNLRLCK